MRQVRSSTAALLVHARWIPRTHLGAQAENQSQAMWAVATRTTEPDLGRLSGLLNDGRIVRTHVLRPTWTSSAPTISRAAAPSR